MPGFIGFPEILLLGLVVLLVFGRKRLPELGRSLGTGIREFKDSITGNKKHEIDQAAIPAEKAGIPSTPITVKPVTLVTIEPAEPDPVQPIGSKNKVV